MKLPAASVTAVIPTRGDLDLSRLVTHLRNYREISAVWLVVGDTPFNRYLAAAGVGEGRWVYTQDDDCITDVRELFENAELGVVVNAMTEEHALHYPGRQTLIGFGAVFQSQLAKPLLSWERDALFLRESDRVFGTIHEHRTYFPAINILPAANNPNRLWKQTEHVPSRVAIEQRIFAQTGFAPR